MKIEHGTNSYLKMCGILMQPNMQKLKFKKTPVMAIELH